MNQRTLTTFVSIMLAGIVNQGVAASSRTDECLRAIAADDSFKEAIKNIYSNNTIDQTTTDDHRGAILEQISTSTRTLCVKQLQALADLAGNTKLQIPYTQNNRQYKFEFKVDDLFRYMPLHVAIAIYNSPDLQPGKVINRTDLPNDIWWNDNCSDHDTVNIDNDAIINEAGRAIELSDNRATRRDDYIIAFDKKPFPGMIRIDEQGSSTIHIVAYNNYKTAYLKFKQYIKKINELDASSGHCQGLHAYLIGLNFSVTNGVATLNKGIEPSDAGAKDMPDKLNSVLILSRSTPLE